MLLAVLGLAIAAVVLIVKNTGKNGKDGKDGKDGTTAAKSAASKAKFSNPSGAAGNANADVNASAQPPLEAAPYYPVDRSAGGNPRLVSPAYAYVGSFPSEEVLVAPGAKGNALCGPTPSPGLGNSGMKLESLMPGSWRSNSTPASESGEDSQWTKFAPQKDKAFRAISSAGSARLSASTRNGQFKILGFQDHLRSATSVPLSSSTNVLFNDSDLRQTAVLAATGSYPKIL